MKGPIPQLWLRLGDTVVDASRIRAMQSDEVDPEGTTVLIVDGAKVLVPLPVKEVIRALVDLTERFSDSRFEESTPSDSPDESELSEGTT